MSTEEPKRLTLEDPVDPETLNELRSLQEARAGVADNLLSLRLEEIHLLAAARKIDDQHGRLFERCLIDRGVSAGSMAEIDAKSGKVILMKEVAPKEPKKAPRKA